MWLYKPEVGPFYTILVYYLLVKWWRHLTMLWYWHESSKQTHYESDNCAHQLCVLMVKIQQFSCKYDQHLSLYCASVKPKFKTGSGYWFLWESYELPFPEFTDNFGTASSNLCLKAVQFFLSHWDNMYMEHRPSCVWGSVHGENNDGPVCLKLVSRKLHTLWRFTSPVN